MEKLNKIFFRADGNTQIGLGHITRSLALADMLKDDFEIFVLIQSPTEAVRKQIQGVGNLIELPSTEDYLQEARDIAEHYLEANSIVVLDGYHFQTEYQKILKAKGVKLVCIDDLHAWHFVADVVINHAGGVKKSDYSCEPYTQLCLGMKYALLRSPFLEAAKQDRKIEKIENVFICFGGSDSNNFTQKALKSCVKSAIFREIYVVVGSAYLHEDSLKLLAEQHKNVHVYQNLDAKSLCEIMQKCHLAIVPASSIAYEVCSVRTYLITGWYVDNQKGIYQSLSENDLGLGVDNFQELANSISNFEMKTTYLENQKKHFDGKSRERINKCLINL
jgi:UDP-2,4-diacetamido-2,4,6-trideoxy-beta-L-altropyranose hydrolase